MKKYLVTGGAGFIGSNLIDRLLSIGHNVVCVDNFNNYYPREVKEKNIEKALTNNKFELFECDITHYDKLETLFSKHRFDCVIHLAARAGVRPSLEDPILYQEVNCRGTQNILELCRKYSILKIVAASSSSVYGNNDKVPFSENDVVDFAISPYAATKKANEVMGHVYHKLYNFNIVFLRFFTVYGPRQRPDLAIYKFARLISNDESINFYGDGSTSRDYTYIDDIIDGIVKSIDYVENNTEVYEVYNLGESEPVTLNEMVSTIEKYIGKKSKKNVMPMQLGDVNRTYADISKAKKLIGYNPQTSFDEGIKKFVNWFLNN